MSSLGCTSCGRENKDESLQQERDKAKKTAIKDQTPQAIYFENGQYHHISAFDAAEQGIPYTEVVLHYL